MTSFLYDVKAVQILYIGLFFILNHKTPKSKYLRHKNVSWRRLVQI